MPELTADDIATAATKPQSASVDGQSASAHPLNQQIEASQYQAAETALDGDNDNGGGKSGWGNRITRKARARFRGPT